MFRLYYSLDLALVFNEHKIPKFRCMDILCGARNKKKIKTNRQNCFDAFSLRVHRPFRSMIMSVDDFSSSQYIKYWHLNLYKKIGS